MTETDHSLDSTEDRRLSQRLTWFTRQELLLLEDKLQCRVRGIGKQHEFAIPFLEIDPNVTRVKNRPWVLYVVTGVLFAGVIGGLVIESQASRQNAGMGIGLAIVLGIAFLICLATSLKQTLNLYIFNTSRGRFVIRANKPTAERAQAFIRLMHQEAADARSITQRLTRDLLAALRNDGMLDEWQYEKATEKYCRRPN